MLMYTNQQQRALELCTSRWSRLRVEVLSIFQCVQTTEIRYTDLLTHGMTADISCMLARLQTHSMWR